MQKKVIAKEQSHGEGGVSARQVLAYLLAYAREACQEGSVEVAIKRAKILLPEARLTRMKRILVASELDDLLAAGYEAEAEKWLQEARLVAKTTDVADAVEKMRLYLGKAGLDENGWLEEHASPSGEIENLLAEGKQNRKKNLQNARERRILQRMPSRQTKDKTGVKL